MPKPKIKELTENSLSRDISRKLSRAEIFNDTSPAGHDLAQLSGLTSRQSGFSVPEDGIFPKRIGFFGSWTEERRLCYLVDCSGSMRGMLQRVRKELKKSIDEMIDDRVSSRIAGMCEVIKLTGKDRRIKP